MNEPPTSLDWSLIHAFLAVAETGSLSAAADRLGSSQPTMSRKIKEIEAQLGAAPFHRVSRGLELTDLGAALLDHARAMRDAAQQIDLIAAGQETQLAGSVRITASLAISLHFLPGILADLRISDPQIQIDLVPSDDTQNLLFREADIAIRMYRPEQQELITRHLGDIPLGMFAAHSYLKRRGTPRSIADLQTHDFVGFDRDRSIIDGMQAMGIPADRNTFATRCDDNVTYLELVRAGCGIGFAQLPLGRACDRLVELDLGLTLPVLPVWLTAHPSLHQTPRIRRVWDALAHGLKPLTA
jgi:DNA-binding transcriptional LysR family regulator